MWQSTLGLWTQHGLQGLGHWILLLFYGLEIMDSRGWGSGIYFYCLDEHFKDFKDWYYGLGHWTQFILKVLEPWTLIYGLVIWTQLRIDGWILWTLLGLYSHDTKWDCRHIKLILADYCLFIAISLPCPNCAVLPA